MPNWKKLIVSGSDASLNSLNVTTNVTAQSFTGSLFGTSSYSSRALTSSYALTASYVTLAQTASNISPAITNDADIRVITANGNGTLNGEANLTFNGSLLNVVGNLLVSGSAAVGTGSLGPFENTVTLGARDTGGEGGQIGFNASGGTYTSASFIDLYQNQIRILKGTNAGSVGLVTQWNLHSNQMQLPSYNSTTAFNATTLVGLLGFDSSGNILTAQTSSAALTGGATSYLARWASSTALTTGSVYDTGTAVGIGNTTPAYKLDVSGDIRATGAMFANANGTMYFRGGDDAELWDVNVANTLGVYGQQDSTIGSIKLGSNGGIISGRVGNIGIGTTNPTTTLEVNGNVKAVSFTGSLSGSATNAVSASYALTASYTVSASYAVTSSYALTASYVNPLNQNLIVTGSIIATGGVTASNALINGNLTVVGTASFNYTTASIVNIGAATITLNTDNPGVRFGGINVIDSGSFGTSSTGSLFWDSQKNRWIYSNPSGSTYDGGLLISGPRNTTGLGNEEGTTLNALMKGQGGDHITSSGMFEDSSGNVGVGTASPSAKFEVVGNVKATSFTGSFSGSVTAPGSTTQIVYNDNGVLAANSGLVYSGSNVGIGISAPTDKLHIVSSAAGNQFGRITATDSNSSAAWVAQNDSGDNVVYRVFSSGVSGTQMGSALGRSASLLANLGGSGVFLLGTFSNTDFILGTNNTENMRITTAGNVGIGTTSPGAARLNVVSGNNSNNPIIEAYALNLSQGMGLAYSGLQAIGSNADVDIVITPKGTGKSYFSTGNVGIGTTNPSEKLTVGNGNIVISGSDSTNYLIGVKSLNSNNDINGGLEVYQINGWGSKIGIKTGRANGGWGGQYALYSETVDDANLSYPSQSAHTKFNSKTTASYGPAVVYIDSGSGGTIPSIHTYNGAAFAISTGSVGIGTTSPSQKLHLYGSGNQLLFIENSSTYHLYAGISSNVGIVGSSNATPLSLQTNGVSRLYIDTTGNVGIGTTSPGELLEVVGNIRANISNGGGFMLTGASASGLVRAGATGLALRTNTTDRLTVDNSGNVGIGTTSPGYKLEVVGAVSASTYYGDGSNLTGIGSGSVAAAGSDGQLQYNNSGLFGGTSRLYYNDSTNRVGIGTSSPGYDLDVSGSARVQDRLRVGPVNSGNGVIHQSSDATINASSSTIVWSVPGSAGICAFIEYYIFNSTTGTSQRAGNIVTTWNSAGTPQITHTETTTPDIGTTALVTFTTSITLGGDPQLVATNTSINPFYIVLNYRYF